MAPTTPSRHRHQSPGLGAQDLGDLAGARAAYERALRIDEKSFGPDHPKVAIDVNNLGSVLQDLGDLAGARAAFERALTIDEKSFGPDHPDVAILRQQPGHGAAGPGRSGGRPGGLRAGARDRREELRPGPPQRRHRRQNLGEVLRALGDLAGARAAFERALRIFEKFLPADHPNIATARENLRIVVEQERSTLAPVDPCRRVAAALSAGAVSRALPWFTCRRCSAAIDPIAPPAHQFWIAPRPSWPPASRPRWRTDSHGRMDQPNHWLT